MRINRGKTKLKEIVEVGRQKGFSDIIILHEHGGIPDGLVLCHLPYGPTAYFGLYDVTMRHDMTKKEVGTISEQFPHLIFENFNTNLGKRIKNILKFLFPAPKTDSKRISSFINKHDFILFRHYIYKTKSFERITLIEIGPRFTMRTYQIKLGTLDVRQAEIEWVFKPYMNTTRKRDIL